MQGGNARLSYEIKSTELQGCTDSKFPEDAGLIGDKSSATSAVLSGGKKIESTPCIYCRVSDWTEGRRLTAIHSDVKYLRLRLPP